MNDDRNDDNFDSAVRHILRTLPVPEFAPVRASRRNFLRRGAAAAAGLATLGMTGWMATSYAATPRIVRLSIAHAEEERAIRGVLVPDMATVLRALSLPANRAFPGIVQLCKDCVVGPYTAWHLNAYMDNLGPVQVFVFRTPVPDASGQGSWFGQHWQFLQTADRFPLLLLSRRPKALEAMATSLQRSA